VEEDFPALALKPCRWRRAYPSARLSRNFSEKKKTKESSKKGIRKTVKLRTFPLA
jgi:hypothetical protein